MGWLLKSPFESYVPTWENLSTIKVRKIYILTSKKNPTGNLTQYMQCMTDGQNIKLEGNTEPPKEVTDSP